MGPAAAEPDAQARGGPIGRDLRALPGSALHGRSGLAFHDQLRALDAADLRATTYANSESVLRLLAHMVRNEVPPSEAEPPPAAVEYAREFVRLSQASPLLVPRARC